MSTCLQHRSGPSVLGQARTNNLFPDTGATKKKSFELPTSGTTMPSAASAPASPATSEPRVSLVLVDTSHNVFPESVCINRGKRTKVTIGRAEDSDVVVGIKTDDPANADQICVSRLHCEIEKNPCGEWALFDKGSRNGCFVNGVKVSSTVLNDGDIIVLGGGGIIQSGAHVQNVESIFQYRFRIQAPRTPQKQNDRTTGCKRKSPEPSSGDEASSSEDGSATKRNTSHASCHHAHSHSENGPLERLHDELSCGICLDVQIHPRVLKCGHSFCARCISTALGYQNRCPSCKKLVVSVPQKVVSLENAICSIYRNNPEYRTRRQEYEKLKQHERITSEKLIHVIEKARTSGRRFLLISNKWNASEREVFKTGVLLYKGLARVEYCKTVGLTSQYLSSATPEQLAIASYNLSIAPTTECSMKDRLRMFIKYG